jgi:hypothetical protein
MPYHKFVRSLRTNWERQYYFLLANHALTEQTNSNNKIPTAAMIYILFSHTDGANAKHKPRTVPVKKEQHS